MFEKNNQVITLVDPFLCAIEVVYIGYLIKSSQEQYVVDIKIIPILQMEKLRLQTLNNLPMITILLSRKARFEPRESD